ncbi:MAG: L-threonylcarbamoyladenylate synthase [Bacteroidota bacterium]
MSAPLNSLCEMPYTARIGPDVWTAQCLLQRGEVVAIPTETVYGLAGNAYDTRAVTKIFSIKQRPYTDPLIVHIGCMAQLEDVAHALPAQAQVLAKEFWPGPLTLLLAKKPAIPDLVTAGSPCVAVRMPNHAVTLHLLRQLSFPLAAPSANPFGYISPTTPQHVANQLGTQVPYILSGGRCRVGVESTIVGFEHERPILYRLGGIRVEAIEALLGPVRVANSPAPTQPVVPGSLLQHYAPTQPLTLGDIPQLLRQNREQRVGILAWDHYDPGVDTAYQRILSPTASLEEAAQHLFAHLRTLDALPIDRILATHVPDVGLGRAINDRLRRAARA